MKAKTILMSGFFSAALLLSAISDAPQSAAVESVSEMTATRVGCSASHSSQMTLNEATVTGPMNLTASNPRFDSFATSTQTLLDSGMAKATLPMHTKRDCDRAYARDSKMCRKAPGGARGRAICWAAISVKYGTCLAGARG